MQIEFTAGRSPSYFRALLRPAGMRAVRRILLTALGSALLGVLLVVVSQGEGVGTVVGCLLVVPAMVSPLKARRAFVATVTVPASWTAPRRYLITGEGLESNTDATSARWSWRVVQRVEKRPEAFLLWRDDSVTMDVPRKPMTTDQDAALLAFFVSRGLLPAHESASPAFRNRLRGMGG